jgi:hypothetical protein
MKIKDQLPSIFVRVKFISSCWFSTSGISCAILNEVLWTLFLQNFVDVCDYNITNYHVHCDTIICRYDTYNEKCVLCFHYFFFVFSLMQKCTFDLQR